MACLLFSGGLIAAEKAESAAEPLPWQMHKVRVIDAGRIETLHVAPGDYVEVGQLLVTLDNFRQKHQLEVAKVRAQDVSKIKEITAEVSLRESVLEDIRQKSRRRLATELDIKQAEAQFEGAQAKLLSAESARELAELDLEMAKHNYANRFLQSPAAGVVMTVEKEAGESVAAGLLLVTIAENENWKTQVTLTPEIAASLREGNMVPITLADGRRNIAKVARIIPGADGTLLAEMLIPNPNPNSAARPQEPEFHFSELNSPYAYQVPEASFTGDDN